MATPDLIVVPTAKNGPVVGVKPDAKGMMLAGQHGRAVAAAERTRPTCRRPLVHDGLVYLCRENGIADLPGREDRQGALPASGCTAHRYRASPVYADGKVYLTSRDGMVTVVKAGPKFERLAENRLRDEMTASPAIADGRIYLRGFGALYAIK